MPIYRVNGKTYNIPDDKVEGFEAKYPDATVEYHNEGKRYAIPLDKRVGFLSRYPNASYNPAPADKSQYTFTGQQLGLEGEPLQRPERYMRTQQQTTLQTPMWGTITTGESKSELARDMGESDGRGGISEYIEMLSGVKSEGQEKMEEQLRTAKERAARGETNLYPYGDTQRPLVAAPDIRVKTPWKQNLTNLTHEMAADRAVERAEEGLKPATDAWTQAQRNAFKEIERREREAKKKKAAEDAVGEMRERLTVISDRLADADAKRPPVVVANPTTMGGVLTKQRAFEKDYRELQVVDNLLSQTEKMVETFNAGKEMGGWTNLGRSMATTAFNPKTWDFGLTDAKVAERLLSVVEKADKGEKLSESEHLLLDAAINHQVMQGYYSELSNWQKAGQMFGESLPFMVQIAANPLVSLGKYASSKASKAVVRHIAKRVGEKGVKKILAKTAAVTGRMVGDLAGSYGVALTTNLGNTTADALNRQIGDIRVDYDDNGVARYDGRTNVMDAGRAWRDAVNNQAFEFYSEQMGNYFAPIFKGMGKLGGKTLKGFGLDGVNKWIDDFAKKGNVQLLNQFLDRTQFHGFASEYAEEIANGMLNAAFVGDMTMEEVFGKDNLVDTAIGLSVMGAIGPMVATAGYARAKHKEKQALKAADENGRRLMGHAWESFAEAVRRSKNGEELSVNLRETLNRYGRRALPGEDMRQIFAYAQAYNRYKAVEEVSAKAVAEGVADERDLEQERLFDEGAHAENKNAVRVEYEEAVNGLGQWADIVENLNNDNALDLADDYEERGEVQMADAIRRFVNARSMHAGMTADIVGQARRELEAATAEIDAIANKKDGNIYSVTLGGGSKGYVTGGTIITDEEGNIDENATREANEGGYLYIMQEGRVRQLVPEALVSLDNVESAEEAKAMREAEINAAFNARYEELTAPVPEAAPAPQTPAQETAPAASNEAAEDAVRALGLSADELNDAVKSEQKGLSIAAKFEAGGDADGANAIRAYVAERFGTQAEAAPTQGNNGAENITIQGNNGAENITIQGNNGADKREQSTSSLDAMPSESNLGEANAPENITQAPENVAPAAIPVEKRGKEERQAFHLVPVERTTEELYNSGLDQREIDAFVQANIDEINGDIEKHNKNHPKMGANIAAYKAAKEQWQAEGEDLAAPLSYYKGLQEHIKSITTSDTAEAINDGVADIGDITTPEEFIAAQLGGIKITPESFRKETGLSAAEQKALVGVIAGEDKGGVSVERAAEIITDNYSEELAGLGFKGDMLDVRDAIIEILSGGNPKTYAKRAAEARQQQVVDERRAQMDYTARQLGFDTVDELIAYEETILPRIIEQYAGYDEQAYYNILDNDYTDNYDDITRESETVGRGGNVLQGEEPVTARGIEPIGAGQQGGAILDNVQGSVEDVPAPAGEPVGETEELNQSEDNLEMGARSANEASNEEHPTVKAANEGRDTVGGSPVALAYLLEGGQGSILSAGYFLHGVAAAFPAVNNEIETLRGAMSGDVLGMSPTDFVAQRADEIAQIGELITNAYGAAGAAIYNELLNNASGFVPRVGAEVDARIEALQPLDETSNRGKQNDTTTLQNTVSDSKDTTISPTTNELGEKSAVPSVQEQIQAAEEEVNTNPTEAQKEAGNYKKGHVQIGTFNVTIEQPKGSVRSGVDADGNKWETEMQNTYGYIRGTEGVDGDHIDVFLSDDIDGWDGHKVFVVDQRNADGSFDEHKVMLGFNDINDAEAAYMSNYKEGWQGLGAITGVSIEEFEKWIASSHRKTKAFAEYKSVKTAEGQSASQQGEPAEDEKALEIKQQLLNYPNRDLKKLIKSIEEAMPHYAYTLVHTADEQEFAKAERDSKYHSLVLKLAKEVLHERDNGSWRTDFGVKLSYNKDITIEDVKTLFENLNGDKAVGELFNKVYAVAKTLGLKIKISDQLSAATGNAGNDGLVKYGAALFYRADIDNQSKAGTLLHELIHTCTMYATTLHKNRTAGGVISKMYEALPVEIKEACKELERIYSLVKDNDVLKGQYGINSVDEMVAELSNSDFRGKLKEIGLWERIVNAIKRLFDFPIKTDSQRASDALTEAERVLEVMLDNFDKGTYDEVRNRIQASGRGRKRNLAPKAELQRGSLSLDGENPAFKAATEKTMQVLENTGVEVVMATEEQVKAMMGADFSRAAAPFYSNARKAVLDIKQEKATPAQWVAMLKKNGGLKAGEDAWVGLEAWLGEQQGAVTKQEILDYLAENSIQIEEVEYAKDGEIKTYEELPARSTKVEDWRYYGREQGYVTRFWAADVLGGVNGKVFITRNSLKADGREVFVPKINSRYLQQLDEDFPVYYDTFEDAVDGLNEYFDKHRQRKVNKRTAKAANDTRLEYTTDGLKNKREIALTVPTIEPYNQNDDVHFGDAGGGRAVAWVRFGETTDSEGKRVLVIDEIQSKRHQDGREKGYKDEQASERERAAIEALRSAAVAHNEYRKQLEKKYGYNEFTGSLSERIKRFYNSLTQDELLRLGEMKQAEEEARDARDRAYDAANSIPSAPFEKNWHELAMKRMLRLAAEEGFDKVAWTTGEQQARRYDMSRQVESISVEENTTEEFSDGTPVAKNIIISTTNGMDIRIVADAEGVIHGGEYGGKHLSDVVGKEIAEKIMQPGSFKLEGDGLRIGGEGMKGFYDKMLPSFVQKYTKKWGAKVGEVTMPALKENNTMHSVDVTPEMRENVMQGQPMFLRTSDGTVYGWTVSGKIFLTPEGVNPNTPVHEYTHLWASAIEQRDPGLWAEVVEAMKLSPVWADVMADEAYRDIWNDENRTASEVLSRLTGNENYRRTMQEAALKESDPTRKFSLIAAWGRVKRVLAKFWNRVREMFDLPVTGEPGNDAPAWERFVNSAIGDFYGGVNPNVENSPVERMFIGEKGATNLDKAEEATIRLDNLAIAREMETAKKDAKSIKMATGWERGADGKWRYETEDLGQFDLKPINLSEELVNGKAWFDGEITLGELFRDNELFKSYPLLKDTKVKFGHFDNSATKGSYNEKTNTISLPKEALREVAMYSEDNAAKQRKLLSEIDALQTELTKENLKLVDEKLEELGKLGDSAVYGINIDMSRYSFGSVMAHEIQHAIQYIEGFAKGGNPRAIIGATDFESHAATFDDLVKKEFGNNDFSTLVGIIKGEEKVYQDFRNSFGKSWDNFFDNLGGLYNTVGAEYFMPNYNYAVEQGRRGTAFEQYEKLAGEVESRNVQGRMNMSAEERRASLAAETEDVAREDQIFLYDNLGESAMVAESERQKPFHDMIDDLYSNGNVDKSKYAMTYFHVAETPAFMENIGLVGAEFTIPFKAISTHIGKDADHKLTADIWHELPNALQHPFLITKYGEDGRFRIYTTLLHNGKYVAVGVDVKRINQGRNKPIVEINSIKTVFAKTGRIGENETVVCYDERITPEQEALLNGRNFRQYPTIQELSADKGSENISNSQEDNDIRFRSVGGNSGYVGYSMSKRAAEARVNDGITSAVNALAAELNTDVEIVNEVKDIPDARKRGAKGWYENGRVYIVLPNATSVDDAVETLLHEAVAHYGLRQLFGEHFDTFLDNVFKNADVSIRQRILELAQKKNWDLRTATEEYLDSLAENTEFENTSASWWRQIKDFFLNMLHKIGFEDLTGSNHLTLDQTNKFDGSRSTDGFRGVTLTDNELRYILWRSYENLAEPGKHRSILGEVSDIAKQYELKVGNYATNTNAAENDALFRDGDPEIHERALARDRYERRVKTGMFQSQEALQDSMLGLKEAMQAILGQETYIEDVDGFENAYLGENRLSSVNKAEADAFAHTLFRPMLDEVAKLARTEAEREELTDYMMAKHGLERNRVMAERDAKTYVDSEIKKLKKELNRKGITEEEIKKVNKKINLLNAKLDGVEKNFSEHDARIWYETRRNTIDRLWANGEIDETEYKKRINRLNKIYKEGYIGLNRGNDYAGLTALTGMDNVADAEAEAQRIVDDYEQAHDTTDLWEKVNAVSKAILQKSYECGMMSKETFDKVSNMYEFYIPLRGFDEKTSNEAYAYLTHKDSAFNAPIKKAEGRKSKADDPFANLQSMAESAIMQGNRNKLVKQRFLNFVLNHPSDLVSVSDIWVEYDDVADEWKPVFPDNIESTDTPEKVEQKMQDFETKMEALAENNPDKYKKGKDAVGIPYRVVESRDMREHQIIVKRGGRDYVITINGNPRAAQAINGLTNPDNEMVGAIGAILRTGEKINRLLSAAYTTRNPDFIISNFMRDMLYSNSMVWVKESPNYALRFHLNSLIVNPFTMKRLLAKYRKGTLNMNDKTEAMFHQFMMNGGETGYANIRDIEQHKNDIRKEIKQANGKLKLARAWSWLWERLDELNRAIENCARFAAFVTSREMGRSIDRSIYDAKEISVNFNEKGSGAKFYDSVGQTTVGNASAMVSGLGRSGFVFWNAAIQGSTNFGRQLKRHPVKTVTGMATMFLLGAIVAYLGGDDDEDDKNAYYNLPEYVRRSNILFRVGDRWISIPLPIEYRAIYGMGELMTSVLSGKEHLTGGEIAEAIAGQVTQILPLDFLEGGGGLNAFVPSVVKPLWEAYIAKKSWTGLPLYKDNPYNKNMPEWTKAYKSANKYIVNLAAVLNEATGGDAYTKGAIDINPAQIEYMLNGYFGGVASTIDKLTKMYETAVGDREYDPRSFLLWNRLVKAGDERTEYRAVNNEYYRLKKERDETMRRLRAYEKDADNGILDYLEKIDFLYNSPEYERALIFDSYYKDGFGIGDYDKAIKEETDDEIREELTKEQSELKRELVKAVKSTYNK
ncbi:MAG: hypothetical protein IKM47_06515 [Bacteroidaceae bacterium]|nr:hypothetical protein [Bacteroidaceae bacterium]